MNVLMLSLDGRVFEKGSEVRRRMFLLASRMQSLHIIVFTKQQYKFEVHDHTFFLTSVSSEISLKAIWRAYRHARTALNVLRRPAIITSQDAFTNLFAFALRLTTGVPVQVQVHTDFFAPEFRNESWKNYARYLLYYWSVRWADCVRVVSERLRRTVIAQCRIPDERVFVLPVAVDRERLFDAHGPSLRALYPGRHPIVLVVARLTAEKNVALALEIFAQLLRRLPRSLLLIAGDGPERKALELSARELGIASTVHFLGWQENPAPLYRAADALLVTSRYEGYGRVFVEAAVLKCPIVSTDVGIVGEILIPGKSVLLFQTREEAADHLFRLATDYDFRAELIRRAEAAVVSLPQADRYAAQFQNSLADCSKKAMTKRHFPKYY